MKNSLCRKLYHAYITTRYKQLSFRGGWMLTSLFIQDYKVKRAGVLKIARAHLNGWSYNDWKLLGINNNNKDRYLSTLNYCRLHPLNDNYSAWIDDKLTLKYILNGTDAGRYMPDYYFEIGDRGEILPLMDVDGRYREQGIAGIIQLLEDKGFLAFKLIKGSLGAGFYKVEYHLGRYWINSNEVTKEQLIETITSLKGYLVSEFLLPHPDIARYYDKSVGCLRYIIGKRLDGRWQRLYSFMRIGTSVSKSVENYNSGGVLCVVNDGHFCGGHVLDFNNFNDIHIDRHPDSGLLLKGEIPLWSEVETAAAMLVKLLPQMTYLGIDFCITNRSEVKIIEINSLSSLDSFQTEGSILEQPGGGFFKERMK